jgi:hydrogenase 3 maturation protease
MICMVVLKMKKVILCIGNREGGDDAVGPLIADRLTDKADENLIIIDAGIAPENFTGVVKQHDPERLIIIDAVEMGRAPGEIRNVPPERIGLMHMSTHGIPLSVLIKYLRQYVQDIFLIGIQPKKMDGEMSKEVSSIIPIVVTLITEDSINKITMLD